MSSQLGGLQMDRPLGTVTLSPLVGDGSLACTGTLG